MARIPKEVPDLSGKPFGGALHQGSLQLAANKVRLELDVGLGVFSGATVDVGTQLLLRTLVDVPASRILDLGCGYGPIGLMLASQRPASRTVMMDRDAVALAYAAHNAIGNRIDSEVVAGLGWADRPDGFEPDLAVSNIPAKAGSEVIRHLMLGGPRVADGLRAVVVIDRIAAEVESMLNEGGADVVLRKANRAHLALHYRLSGPALPDPGLDAHRRGRRMFSAGRLRWELDTGWGLPEFDTLTYSTKLVAKALREIHRRPEQVALVVNPGAGHLPVIVSQMIEPVAMHLAGRDLLALRLSAANVVADGGVPPELHHSPLPQIDPESVDLVVLNLSEKLTTPAVDAVVRTLAAVMRPAGRLLVAGTSTAVHRTLAAAHLAKLPLIPLDQRKDSAHSVADLVRT